MPRIRLNTDAEIVRTVREGLKETGGFCPCHTERISEYKCICQEIKAQRQGSDFESYCHCKLYYKEKRSDTGG